MVKIGITPQVEVFKIGVTPQVEKVRISINDRAIVRYTDLSAYLTIANFNTNTGDLTLIEEGDNSVTVNLDGRYLTEETDPVFTAWDKSLGISITASQVTDFDTEVSNNPSVVLNTAKESDKNYIHNQSVASDTWSVQHNLGKFPSATMVLSTGQKGYGDVNYIDENNLTITLASAESGKAYIN